MLVKLFIWFSVCTIYKSRNKWPKANTIPATFDNIAPQNLEGNVKQGELSRQNEQENRGQISHTWPSEPEQSLQIKQPAIKFWEILFNQTTKISKFWYRTIQTTNWPILVEFISIYFILVLQNPNFASYLQIKHNHLRTCNITSKNLTTFYKTSKITTHRSFISVSNLSFLVNLISRCPKKKYWLKK